MGELLLGGMAGERFAGFIRKIELKGMEWSNANMVLEQVPKASSSLLTPRTKYA